MVLADEEVFLGVVYPLAEDGVGAEEEEEEEEEEEAAIA